MNVGAAKDRMGAADDAAALLLDDWSGPFGGTPPFDRIDSSAFESAVAEGVARQWREVQAIIEQSAAPTFENTVLAMERAGRPLGRVLVLYETWISSLNTGDIPALERRLAPQLAAFQDRIHQDPQLFSRLDQVHAAVEAGDISPQARQLTRLYWSRSLRAGARLPPSEKRRVTEINQELAGLYTQFSQNLLADETAHVLFLKAADLGGLPPHVLRDAAAAAAHLGRPGEFAIPNTRSAIEPFLSYSSRRDLREAAWRRFSNRGGNQDHHDNTVAVVPRILALRAEKARLMGHPSYAAWKLADDMAGSPDAAMNLMMAVWPSARARILQEVSDMQAAADREGAAITIAPWDYRYYAEKVRQQTYALDMAEVAAYLQLDRMRDALFWVAGRLYGFTFVETAGVGVFEPSVQVFEARTREGRHLGLWYFDPYARAGKNSGAWMNAYRLQHSFDGGASSLVGNTANFAAPEAGRPTLISWDDARTLFHEFGHALHGLAAQVDYPSLAGPNQALDFVELPSQIFENWLSTPDVLTRFAVDVDGQPIPADLVEKIVGAADFNQGFAVGEYLAAAIVDMKLHTCDPAMAADPAAFEAETLAALQAPDALCLRHRIPQFQHVFAGDGYAAGYYAYLWAEVLALDAYDAFVEAGDPYDPAVASRFLREILQVGHSVDPGEAYRRFRGRDARVGAYLKAKGFSVGGGDAASPRPAR